LWVGIVRALGHGEDRGGCPTCLGGNHKTQAETI
jgi:hypothetical protein